MRTRVQKWGNSLALRIPAGIAEDIHLAAGDAVEVTVVNGALAVNRILEVPTLEDLLASIPPDIAGEEVDFGRPEGNEAL